MGIWTLNYNGTEQAFPAWSIRADAEIELVSKGKWIARLPTTEAYDAATPQFAYGNPVTIWQNRTAVGSGGSIYFAGWVGRITRQADGPRQGIVYECYDLWWKLERQIFRQVRNAATGYNATTGVWTYGTPQFLCEIYLGERVNLAGQTTSLVTNGAEISEILSWMNEVNNPTRRGNAYAGSSGSVNPAQDLVNFWGRPGADIWPPSGGLPGTPVDAGHSNAVMDPQAIIPVTRVQTIYCAEAIVNMLRWSPSVTVQRDFTTTPVTLSFRDQLGGNALPLVTITLTSAQERQIRTRPENERQLPGVVIDYRRVGTINGQPYLATENDVWPGTVSMFTPEVVSQFIELDGGSETQVSAEVEVVPLANATSGSGTTQLDFWSEYEPLLQNNPNIVSGSITFNNASFTAQDVGSSTAVNTTTYPNVLLPKSSVAPWMQGIVVTDAVISIQVSFTQKNAGGQTTHETTRYIHARVKLTNAVTQTYIGVTHLDSGEPFPATGSNGLAKQIYSGISALTHSGRITLLESQLAAGDLSGLVPGAPLKLVGPNNTYTNLFIQSVCCRPHFGELDIEFGPAARLDAADLIELARCTRLRTVYDLPSGRGTGQPSSGPSVDATADSPVENTSAPPGDNSYFALYGA